MSRHPVSFSETGDDEPNLKYKCSVHGYYTNDRAAYEKHLMDPSLSHIEQISNGECMVCGGRLDADTLEGVEYRHHITGKSTHKDCRMRLYNDIVNANPHARQTNG